MPKLDLYEVLFARNPAPPYKHYLSPGERLLWTASYRRTAADERARLNLYFEAFDRAPDIPVTMTRIA